MFNNTLHSPLSDLTAPMIVAVFNIQFRIFDKTYFHTLPTKYLSLPILLVLALLGLSPINAQTNSSAQTNPQPSELQLYLPYHSSQFPELAQKLDAALQRAGLNNIRTQSSDYWHPYQQGIRQGRVGVYLAPPHFVASCSKLMT